MHGRVKDYIKENHLVAEGDRVLLAVSGGPDSMALMNIMHKLAPVLGISLHVVHLDHRFRGKESAADAEFVRQKSSELNLPATILSYDVSAYKRKHRISAQDAARRVRYGLFFDVAKKVGAVSLAVAHHRDDQVETILINLLRGTGPEGLRGMQPRRFFRRKEDLFIIRPLLECRRGEIEAYVAEQHITSRLDKTNLKDTYLRNKVRLHLLPLLEKEYNPGFREGLISLSQVMSETEEYLEGETLLAWKKVVLESVPGRVVINRSALRTMPDVLKGRLFRRALGYILPSMREIGFGHISRLKEHAARGKTGGSLTLPGNVRALLQYDELHLLRDSKVEAGGKARPLCVPLPVPGKALLGPDGQKIVASLLDKKEMPWTPDEAREAFIDYDSLFRSQTELTIRGRLPGDRFNPLGLKGSKKLKDFLIDKKIPRHRRENLLLVTQGSHILWVVGLAISEKNKISAKTERILHLKIE